MPNTKSQRLPPHCTRAVKELADLRSLRAEYSAARTNAIRSGEIEKAKDIAAEVSSAIATLEATIFEHRITTKYNPFIQKTFEQWYRHDTEVLKRAKPKSILISPASINYAEYLKDKDSAKFGEYTLNPNTQKLTNHDFERLEREGKITLLELPKMVGKSLPEIATYLVATYSPKQLPGIEYWEYINRVQGSLKDIAIYPYFFGSLVRNRNGHWCVPRGNWVDGRWIPDASEFAYDWRVGYRVVLLET